MNTRYGIEIFQTMTKIVAISKIADDKLRNQPFKTLHGQMSFQF